MAGITLPTDGYVTVRPHPIVTSTYRYKRPPRKRKAAPLEEPAIMGKHAPASKQASAPKPAEPANGRGASFDVTTKSVLAVRARLTCRPVGKRLMGRTISGML